MNSKRISLWVGRAAVIGTLVLGTTACVNFPYRAPIQQGNVIEPERAAMLRTGLTKEQVANIAGTPVLFDLFHKDRWDYIYRLDERAKDTVQQRVTILFQNDVAVKIERQDVR